MRRTSQLAACLAAFFLGSAPAGAETREEVIKVPGFADFLAVSGKNVWVTNRTKVELWSRSGKVAEAPMTRSCGAMAVFRGSLWAADCKEGSLHRIDARTGRTIAVIPTGIANVKGELNVVSGAGSVWIASEDKGTLARINPATNQVVASIAVTPGTYYLAFGFGSVWGVSNQARTLQQIDPRTNTAVKTIALGNEPGFLAAGAGAVWVQEQADGTVARIDPRTGTITGRVKVGETLKYGDIDVGGGKVWLRTTEQQTFAVIDPKTMTVSARKGGAEGSGALRFTKAGVWTSAHDVHTLTWWPRPADK